MAINFNSFANTARSVVSSGQQTLGTIGNSVNTIKNNIVNAKSQLEGAITGGFSKFGETIRSSNIKAALSAGVKTSIATAEFGSSGGKDWRVKLSYPIDTDFISSPVLSPLLETGGLVFPYTPSIMISHSASYQALDPIHNNYSFFAYQNSKIDSMTITGNFYCEDAVEARYWVAAVHYLRSVTKMFYGETSNAGAPPPIVRLSGYGDYVFNNVPVIITNFSVELPDDVDYIQTGLAGLAGLGGETGASLGQQTSHVPVKSQIIVTVQPVYSREQVRQFSLGKFVSGEYVINGTGFV
jgi:hypothetical protein